MHTEVDLKVLYFGTPVVLISTQNEDGSPNIAPMSSAWWLGHRCVLGLSNVSHTVKNLRRERECVLNLVPSSLVEAVDRLALLTGSREVPEEKKRRGYRYEPDKFTAAGLRRQASQEVRPPRVYECPIQLESVVTAAQPVGPDGGATAFETAVVRIHVDDQILIPGKAYIDPLKWDPLIMKFCEYFGAGENIFPSQLAAGWQMPPMLSTVPAGRRPEPQPGP